MTCKQRPTWQLRPDTWVEGESGGRARGEKVDLRSEDHLEMYKTGEQGKHCTWWITELVAVEEVHTGIYVLIGAAPDHSGIWMRVILQTTAA